MSTVKRKEVVELAWLLGMETDPTVSMATLFERVRARAAQLSRIVNGCGTCAAAARCEVHPEDRRLAASISEAPAPGLPPRASTAFRRLRAGDRFLEPRRAENDRG